MKRIALLLAVAALVITGCGSDSDPDDSSGSSTTTEAAGTEPAPADTISADQLDGKTFDTTAVTGYELPPDGSLTLTFDDGTLSASGGCNGQSGAYEIDGTTLAWTDTTAGTMMACDQALMDQDQWLVELLTGGVEATLVGDELTLTAGDVTISLTEATAVNLPFAGTEWTLESTGSNDAVSSLPAGVEAPTLTVGDDGSAAVFTGCNNGSTTVELSDDGATATFGMLAMTRMACGDEASQLEATVTTVLEGEVAVEIEGPAMTITNGDQSLLYRGA